MISESPTVLRMCSVLTKLRSSRQQSGLIGQTRERGRSMDMREESYPGQMALIRMPSLA